MHDSNNKAASSPRRLATASIVGTTLEYYDFAVYNTLAALVFNRLFFPSFDPVSGTILAFSTFAVGYFSRPFGGLIFGHLGDRRGRRFVLVTTLVIMGVTTALMGALPTYEVAGAAAPLLLVGLRFVQGAALGGEWAGAVLLSVEHGRPEQRGRNASWAQMGPSLGTLLATGTIALLTWLLPAEAFDQWGWRIPFFASVVLVAFGLWIRIGVEETPLFRRLEAEQQKARAPIGEVFRSHWRGLLIGGGARIGPDVLYSLTAVFSLSYLTTITGQSRTLALLALSIAGACNAVAIPFFGSLSDRHGRRAVYGVGAGFGLAWMLAFFAVARQRIGVLDRCSACGRADHPRDDVRPAGRIHCRTVSDASALRGSIARVHAGRHRRRRHCASGVHQPVQSQPVDVRCRRLCRRRAPDHARCSIFRVGAIVADTGHQPASLRLQQACRQQVAT